MGMCWSCFWGWPKVVADIYKRALNDLGGYDNPLLFGPSHIVWEDENFGHAEWCLEHFEENKGRFSSEELAIVKRSLEELAAIPLSQRDVEPDDYDGMNPDKYPPADGCVMVRV